MVNSMPRSKWTPPPGFIPAASQVTGITVYAPAPPPESQPESQSETQTFRCPQCNGITAYDAGAKQLACPYCGYTRQVDGKMVGLAADRFEFTLDALDQSERGWGIERREIQCEACQAVFSVGSGDLSATCPFCGSNRVAGHAALHEFIRPGYLIPFLVDAKQCRAAVQQWLGKGWMHPAELSKVDSVSRFTGIYIPFWVFDAHIHAQWKAEVGHEHRKSRHRNGKWESYTEIEWRWESGQVHVPVSNMLIYGTDKISTVLLERLYPYNLEQLTVYEASYLAGWQAQAYDIQLKPAWEIGKQRMREQTKDACYSDTHSSHVRNFSMAAQFQDERWRYVLLPVYLSTYAFENKTFHIMVNGQTALVTGQKPVSWLRVWLVIALALIPGVLGGILGLLLSIVGIGLFVLPIAFILFMVGLIAAIWIFNQARSSEAI